LDSFSCALIETFMSFIRHFELIADCMLLFRKMILSKRRVAFSLVWVALLAQLGMYGLAQQPQGASNHGVVYPIAVAIDGEKSYVVDLELPGVWEISDSGRDVFALGSRQLKTPLNRPRCIAIHPAGGVLVGDSATREVYHVAEKGAAPLPLTKGKVGIPMALVVSPDLQKLYIGDAERRSVVEVSIGGGDPTAVIDVNARGLAFDGKGRLWAVTPDEGAVHLIDLNSRKSEVVVKGRPYQYPNGLAWLGDYGLVTDGYNNCIWQFDREGRTDPWLKGQPLARPVGIAIHDGSVWVADPKAKQVFRFEQVDKSFRSLF
jgi:sugar lactone lactonase YvrE